MAILASTYGLGDDGLSVHASGANAKYHRVSLTELLRHPSVVGKDLTFEANG